MYADDTLIICKSNDIDSVTSQIQMALNKMYTWCTANKLSLNLSKTKHLTVEFTKPDHELSVHVKPKCISMVKNYEYLGMSLDNRLSMNEPIDNMWKKANAKVGILTEKTAVNIYKCMICPHNGLHRFCSRLRYL